MDDEFEIFGQRIDAATGAEIGANDVRLSDLGPNGEVNFDAFDPAIAYNSLDNEYLVAWSGDDDTAPLVQNEFEIFGQRIDAATGAEIGANDFRLSDLGPDGSTNFEAFDPALAYNGLDNQYLVVWAGNVAVDGEVEVFGQRIDAVTGAEIGVNDFRISDMGPNGNVNFAAFDPKVVYNSAPNEYLVVWRGDDDTAPLVDNESEIFGQQFIGGVVAPPPPPPLPPPPPPLPPPPPTVLTCQGRRATLVGTEGNDVLRGTARRDVIHGLGGNDKIRGLGGNDVLCGGEGRDQLRGGPGKDRLEGGPGVDLCDGGPNRDQGRACEVRKNIP